MEPGTLLHRYGNPNGSFFAPPGTPIGMRSLPYGTNTSISTTYEVVKPLPAQTGYTQPAFNQVGYGIQHMTFDKAEELIKMGYLKSVK